VLERFTGGGAKKAEPDAAPASAPTADGDAKSD